MRQESQLWTQLHQGLLTTGRLNAALGFYEPAAAKRLSIPRDRVNHNSLLSAAANLQMPAYGLECLDIPAAPVISVQATAAASVISPGLQNAITVSEFEAAAIKLANDSLAGAASIAIKQRRRRPHKPQQQQPSHAAVASNAAVKAPMSLPADSGLDSYATADARRKRCTGVATRGEHKQSTAALYWHSDGPVICLSVCLVEPLCYIVHILCRTVAHFCAGT